jgi:hypothetical protein
MLPHQGFSPALGRHPGMPCHAGLFAARFRELPPT